MLGRSEKGKGEKLKGKKFKEVRNKKQDLFYFMKQSLLLALSSILFPIEGNVFLDICIQTQ